MLPRPSRPSVVSERAVVTPLYLSVSKRAVCGGTVPENPHSPEDFLQTLSDSETVRERDTQRTRAILKDLFLILVHVTYLISMV